MKLVGPSHRPCEISTRRPLAPDRGSSTTSSRGFGRCATASCTVLGGTLWMELTADSAVGCAAGAGGRLVSRRSACRRWAAMRLAMVAALPRSRVTRSPGIAWIRLSRVGWPLREALCRAWRRVSPERSAGRPSTVPKEESTSMACSSRGEPTEPSATWVMLSGTGWFSTASSWRPTAPLLARSSSARSLLPRRRASGLCSSLTRSLKLASSRGIVTTICSTAAAGAGVSRGEPTRPASSGPIQNGLRLIGSPAPRCGS